MGVTCSIGIIGCGRFGRLMARYLSADFRIRAYDPDPAAQGGVSAHAEPTTLETVSQSEVLILAVPISRLQGVLAEVQPRLKSGTLVVDVCSVKKYPIQWMQALLPEDTEILGTHPMFGPDSAAESLEGRKIVLCPVRIAKKRFENIQAYLTSKKLQVLATTASDHDRQIAVSLALTHFIGRTLAGMGVHTQEIDTEGHKRLLRILEVVEHDSWQLFEDMHRYNPYAQDVRRAFMQVMQDIERRIGSEGHWR
jgi:prephenate dehydrogenase